IEAAVDDSRDAADEVVAAEAVSVYYPDADGEPVPVVNDVDLTVRRGEIVGIIGESGSGKSTLANAVAHLLPSSATMTARRASVVGTDLRVADRQTVDAVFRHDVAVVFQEPMSSLNPAMSIGRQLTESLRIGKRVGSR